MDTLIDFDRAVAFAIPTALQTVREGMLIEGPQGWGEFSPRADAEPPVAARWLTSAVEAGTVGWPDAVRGRVPVSVPVPPLDPAGARDLVVRSGSRTADVWVGGSLDDDVARVAAVRDALGPDGTVRCVARGRWDVDAAARAIAELAAAAGRLEFVARPCGTAAELSELRRRVDVPIAADVALCGDGVDVAVLRCASLGGVRRSLRLAQTCGLPCVVFSELETSIGLAAGVALAGALPELPYACSLGTRTLLHGDVVAGARVLTPSAGYLSVAPTPPAPDPQLLDRYAVRDNERVQWWRRRLEASRTAA